MAGIGRKVSKGPKLQAMATTAPAEIRPERGVIAPILSATLVRLKLPDPANAEKNGLTILATPCANVSLPKLTLRFRYPLRSWVMTSDCASPRTAIAIALGRTSCITSKCSADKEGIQIGNNSSGTRPSSSSSVRVGPRSPSTMAPVRPPISTAAMM